MGSTTIHPFPELATLAEEEARAFAAAWAGEFSAAWLAWDALDPATQEKRIQAHLTLLCDLTRPASRDAVARLVAARIHLSHTVSAPALFFYDGSRHRGALRGWYLYGLSSAGHSCQHRFCTVAENETDAATTHPVYPQTYVPGICDVTDPAVALALIVRHLWPEESPDVR